MSLKALQDYTLVSKYARYDAPKKRRETWDEAVNRMRDMHLRRYPQLREDILWAFERVRERRVLGSQRALQFGGRPIEEKNARLYNCTVSHCDRVRMFQEAFWLLLCGSGTGFSVQMHHIAKLPDYLKSVTDRAYGTDPEAFQLPKGTMTFVVPDTIEGWADALGILLASYLPHEEFSEWASYEVEFDYSLIRPKGSPLASGVGRAPGPEPLMRSLEIIRSLLKKRVCEGYLCLRSIDCYDIVMHASDAVLSGGVRRSATICLFSPEDTEMLRAKFDYTDDNGVFHSWYIENPQRGRSNNSVVLIRDQTTRDQFDQIMTYVKQYGEPGFLWSDSTELTLNPCCEIGMYPVCVETGESGWQACNLCEINGGMLKSRQDFVIAVRAAAIIGTLQAGYTDFTYLGDVTRRIVEREALLGVSMTGMMDNPHITFDPELQREMAEMVIQINQQVAAQIGIRPAARCTCVKPAGNSSALLGTGSGIHPHHSRRYIRHVQANALEAPFLHFQETNPDACELSVWNPNGTDFVIGFLVETPPEAKIKANLSAVGLLEHVKLTQENWVTSGKVPELCTADWLSHNVSNTINVRPEEWNAVADFIFTNRRHFAGISLLSSNGDKDYPQAPFTAIYTKEDILRDYVADPDVSIDVENNIFDQARKVVQKCGNDLWAICDEWLAPAPGCNVDTRLSEFFCSRDLDNLTVLLSNGRISRTQMTYFLKDVYNLDKWQRLSASYQDVDYTTMIEEEDNTKLQEVLACAGGACQI